MKPLLSSPTLSAETVAALERLEAAQEFQSVRADYQRVSLEAGARAIPALLAMIPGAALFALIYGGAQALGWLHLPDFFANLFWLLIVPAAAIVSNALRGVQAVKDETRMGHALRKWSAHARKAKSQ